MPMKYYEPEDKQKYKQLRKNWNAEMKRKEEKKRQQEYIEKMQQNRPTPSENHQEDEYEEITYTIKRKKQAEFTKSGKNKRIKNNIMLYIAIATTITAIWIWIPIIYNYIK